MSKKKNNIATIQTVIGREDVAVTANVEENYIFTTEDKVKILYTEYNDAKKHTGEVGTSFSTFLTLLITLLTCEFKSFNFIDSATLHAVFIVATIITGIWFVFSGIRWIRNKKKLSFEYFFKGLQGDKPNE